jgi:hypothetical protein
MAGPKADRLQQKYGELMSRADAQATTAAILEAAASEDAGAEIDALGELLATNAPHGAAVLDALSEKPSVAADTLRAELLVWLARGDEMPSWKKKGRKEKPQLMETDEIGRRAAGLLDHDDPFIRGLAEWAIAIRRLWKLHATTPRLGLYDGREEELPLDYDDVLQLLACRPCLLVTPKRDRFANHNAVAETIRRLQTKNDTITWGAPEYINRFQADQHQLFLEWVNTSMPVAD